MSFQESNSSYPSEVNEEQQRSTKSVMQGIQAAQWLNSMKKKPDNASGAMTVSSALAHQAQDEEREPLSLKGVASGIIASKRMFMGAQKPLEMQESQLPSAGASTGPSAGAGTGDGAGAASDHLHRSMAMGMVGVMLSPRSQQEPLQQLKQQQQQQQQQLDSLNMKLNLQQQQQQQQQSNESRERGSNSSSMGSDNGNGSRGNSAMQGSREGDRPLSGGQKRLRPMSPAVVQQQQQQQQQRQQGQLSARGDNEADLSGFPVIRMDHISMVDSPTLESALVEIPLLLRDMHADAMARKESTPKLAFYLQKQMDGMQAELLKRAAEQRVFSILQGSQDVFADYSSILDTHDVEKEAAATAAAEELQRMLSDPSNNDRRRHSSSVNSSSSSVAGAVSAAGAWGRDQPDRSESAGAPRVPPLGDMPRGSGANLSPLQGARKGLTSAPSAAPSVRNKRPSTSGTDADNEFSGVDNNSSGNPLSTRSLGGTQEAVASGAGGFAVGLPPHERMSRREKNEAMKREKGTAGTATAKVDTNNVQWGGSGDADRKAMQVVYKAFGNEFVVAATERKRRPPPRKKVEETQEQVRNRERADRRKAAMKRLMDRKEKQQQVAAVRRERRMIEEAKQAQIREKEREKAASLPPSSSSEPTGGGSRSPRRGTAARATATAAAGRTDDQDDDSDAESVSGGEDEDGPLPVNPDMVDAVEQAMCVAIAHDSRTKSKSPQRTPRGMGSVDSGSNETTQQQLPDVNNGKKENSFRDQKQTKRQQKQQSPKANSRGDDMQRALETVTRTPSAAKIALAMAMAKLEDEGGSSNGGDQLKPIVELGSDSPLAAAKRKHAGKGKGTDKSTGVPALDLSGTGSGNVASTSKSRSSKIPIRAGAGRKPSYSLQKMNTGDDITEPEAATATATATAATAAEDVERKQAQAQLEDAVDDESLSRPGAELRVDISTPAPLEKMSSIPTSPVEKDLETLHLHIDREETLVQSPRRRDHSQERAIIIDDDEEKEEDGKAPNRSPSKIEITGEAQQSSMNALSRIRSLKLLRESSKPDLLEGMRTEQQQQTQGSNINSNSNSNSNSNLLEGMQTEQQQQTQDSNSNSNSNSNSRRSSNGGNGDSGSSDGGNAKPASPPAGSASEGEEITPERIVVESAAGTGNDYCDIDMGHVWPERSLELSVRGLSWFAIALSRWRTAGALRKARRDESNRHKAELLQARKEVKSVDQEIEALRTQRADLERQRKAAQLQLATMQEEAVATGGGAGHDDDESTEMTGGDLASDLEESMLSPNTLGEGGGKYTPSTPSPAKTPIRPRMRQPIVGKKKIEKPAPLFEERDGVFFCAVGPDELPGLRVWGLKALHEDGSAEWSFDMNMYFMPAPSTEQLVQMRSQRSAMRRTVARGLVVLAQDCDALLRGTKFAQNEDQFKANWARALRNFDERVEELGDDASHMFKQVAACGNCHAVCRKLENLIKTYFALKGNIDFDETAAAKEEEEEQRQEEEEEALLGDDDLREDVHVSTAGHFNKPIHRINDRLDGGDSDHGEVDDDADREDYDDGDDIDAGHVDQEGNEHEKEDEDELVEGRQEQEQERQGEDALAQTLDAAARQQAQLVKGLAREIDQALNRLDEHEEEMRSPVGGNSPNRTRDRGHSSDENGDEGEEDDDDLEESAMIPTYNNNDNDVDVSMISDSDPNADALKSARNRKRQEEPEPEPEPEPELEQPLSARDMSEMALRKSRMDAVIERSAPKRYPGEPIVSEQQGSKGGNNKNGNSRPLKLTDLYKNIGMIFPVAYSQTGNSRDNVDARALVESMQQQSKNYEEWLEVMQDYATVFSEERGFDITGGNHADTQAAIYKGGTRALHFRVKSARPEVYNIVTDVFNGDLKDQWEELPQGLGLGVTWNLLWTWSKPRINMTHLLVWQRVNHFQDAKHLTRKDLLKKSLQRYTDTTSKTSEAFEIMPQTYILPQEYTQLVRAFTESEQARLQNGTQNLWIMKPVGMSRGRGISLVRDVGNLMYSQSTVVQRYVERPLTLDGYKFDLRLYVLVTSFRPLEAFIYKEGFARVSTHAYSLDPKDFDNQFIHLTNASIQKLNEDGAKANHATNDNEESMGGSKIPLHGPHGLWARMEKQGMDTDLVWRNICLCVLKSLVVVDEKMSNQPCCFEVFGFDVLIDKDLKPWLIEVNTSPSMSRDNQLDQRVKTAMIRDTISLVDPPQYDRAAVARVIKRRLNDITKNKFTMHKNDPQLDGDLKDILGDRRPRQVGEEPAKMGDYQRLAPDTKIFQHVLRLKGKILKPMAETQERNRR